MWHGRCSSFLYTVIYFGAPIIIWLLWLSKPHPVIIDSQKFSKDTVKITVEDFCMFFFFCVKYISNHSTVFQGKNSLKSVNI